MHHSLCLPDSSIAIHQLLIFWNQILNSLSLNSEMLPHFSPSGVSFNTAALVRTSKMRERCRTKSTNVIVHKSVTFLHTCFSAIRCCSHQKRPNCYNRPEKVLGLQTRQQFSFLLMSGILPGSSGLLVTQGTSVLHFVPWPLPWFAVAAAAVEKSGK